jgi:proline iminopeptidase
MALKKFYPEIEPYSSGYLKVGDIHTLYWEQSGNPDGVPVVFLHGGPGGGTSPKHRRFFDPEHYRIILFDQRGCGKSEPLGCVEENTPALLVDDIEALRNHFRIEKWHVFGGSWGSTLALLYATEYPQRCLSLVLRGIFLMQQSEMDWLYNHGDTIFPEYHERFIGFLTKAEQKDIVGSYYKRLINPDPKVHLPAARVWSNYESACAHLIPEIQGGYDPKEDQHNFTIARIEAHYFMKHVISEKNSILHKIDRIRHIPGVIIQGRYDIVCPIQTAYKLHKVWPEADYIIVPDGGHSALDAPIRSRLIDATDNMRSIQKN